MLRVLTFFEPFCLTFFLTNTQILSLVSKLIPLSGSWFNDFISKNQGPFSIYKENKEEIQRWASISESGHYYGPGRGADSYTAAKRDFATRSGLIPRSALFDQKQLIEIYHCSVEVQAGLYSITDEQGKCLQSIIDQIELSIPNLGELLDQEQNIEAPEDGGMQFS